MPFIQVMEFEMNPSEAAASLKSYASEGKGVSFARRGIVCADRNRPGTVVQLIFFDSVEDAERNNELELTQRAAAEFSAKVGEVRFIDLDVIADLVI